MIPQFNNGDIRYVRCPRTGKNGVLNVECRNINVASAVKSTFAGLVKSDKPPSYLKNVEKLYFQIFHYWYEFLSFSDVSNVDVNELSSLINSFNFRFLSRILTPWELESGYH